MLKQQASRIDYNYKEWYVDSIEEMNELDTSDACQGSVCYIINDSNVYMLDINKEWVKQTDSTGEGGESGGDDWQPQPDWWDIDSILENDTEDYGGKVICLMADTYPTFTFTGNKVLWSKVKFSDGEEINITDNSDYTHTWDTTKDKPCSLGYGTRYAIFYGDENLSATRWTFGKNAIDSNQIISMIVSATTFGIGFWLGNMEQVQSVKINALFTSQILFDGHPKSLKRLNIANNRNITKLGSQWATVTPFKQYFNIGNLNNVNNMQDFCRNNVCDTNIIFPKNFNLANITNYNNCFNNSRIYTIDRLDFTNCESLTNCIRDCAYLKSIKQIDGKIKVSGLDLHSTNNLNHDTLMRFINALYDYSDSENTYTLVLGATNLSKLTSEEIAVGTNKGWTIS